MRSKMVLIAMVAAALALPGADALAQNRHGGGGGGGGGNAAMHSGGGTHFSGGGARFSNGARFNNGTRFSSGGRSFSGGARFARGGRFHHHRHFRGFFGGPFFASGYVYGDSCWRWRPTAIGWRRVWVCGYPYY